MKVLIVAHAAIRESNRAVYRRLAFRGYDVTLIIPHRWKSVLGGRLDPEPEPVGSPLKLVVRRRMGKSHSNLFFFIRGITDLLGPAKTAIYVDQDPAGLCAYQVARVAQRPDVGLVILSIQNILKRYPFPFNLMQQYVFRRASSALAVSRECETTIIERGFHGPIDIFNFGYDLLPPDEARRNDLRSKFGITGFAVGYVGRFVEEKGIDVLLRAIARVPEATGFIAGDGPLSAPLALLASELGIADRVSFCGPLAPSDAMDVIAALDVCVLPSRTRQNWKEQFGRVLVEAMAQGVPVIGSSSGAIPETMGDAGIVFEEDAVEELAAAIRSTLQPSRRAEMIERGLERAKTCYSIDAVTNVLENALLQSVGQSPNAESKVRTGLTLLN
jgi:glycosyltransferase involved in cell wall biosynthesis